MKGIKLVGIIMAIMVLIGTMMVPAYAKEEKPEIEFETKFQILMDLYFEKEEMEDFMTIDSIIDIEGGHLITLKVSDAGIEDIKSNNDITSDNVDVVCHLIVMNDKSYSLSAFIYADGALIDYEIDGGDNILEDLDLI